MTTTKTTPSVQTGGRHTRLSSRSQRVCIGAHVICFYENIAETPTKIYVSHVKGTFKDDNYVVLYTGEYVNFHDAKRQFKKQIKLAGDILAGRQFLKDYIRAKKRIEKMNNYEYEATITFKDAIKASSPDDAEELAREVIAEQYPDVDPKDIAIVSVADVENYAR